MNESVKLRKVPYGNMGFEVIRSDDFAYVDKTKFIEVLERSGVHFPFIVRPRRFGKTLFTNTLRAYYDKSEAKNFEKNFRGTYIGSHKTPLASQFCVLQFTFAGLYSANAEEEFQLTVLNALRTFFQVYPHPEQDKILDGNFSSAGALIETFFSILGSEYRQKLFILIDEYDHLTNAVLSREMEKFKTITSIDGFFKNFYTKLKSAATDAGPVSRIFVTGVTSISLDSMTSGFSIATNCTTRSAYAALFGFTEKELRQLVPQIVDLKKYGHTIDEIVARMKVWYNGYRFSARVDESVFNASMCLYYLGYIRDENVEPINLLDPSFAQDLQKIRGILELGDQDFVKSIVIKALRNEAIDFSCGELQILNLNQGGKLEADGILSAMFYMGYLTFAENDPYKLVVPNRAVAIQFFEYYLQNILAFSGTSGRYLAKQMSAAYLALKQGDPQPLFQSVSDRFASQNDPAAGLHMSESDFQTLIQASLIFDEDVSVIREAQAAGPEGGRIDLLIGPAQGSSVKNTFLVEFKHLTKKQVKVDGALPERALTLALHQARRYAKCENIRCLPHLKCVAAVYVGTKLDRLVVEDFAG